MGGGGGADISQAAEFPTNESGATWWPNLFQQHISQIKTTSQTDEHQDPVIGPNVHMGPIEM